MQCLSVPRSVPQLYAIAAAIALALATQASAQVPIVQPGAPGQPSRQISAEEAADLASIRYADADVKFLQHMIVHHQQALEMVALVEGRSSREAIRTLSQRIALSQEDEISLMKDWLEERALPLADPEMHHDGGSDAMVGMISAEEMAQLRAATGAEFDELFLQFMIEHHLGAVSMVENLLEQPGSAQDSVLFEFTSDVTSDQNSEIERMTVMLGGFSPDPRANLQAGFRDAGQASLNMELITSLPKPDGFFDPGNPAGLPMSRLPAGVDPDALEEAQPAPEEIEEGDERGEPRPSLLNFANTDIAFAEGLMIAGNYHGFNIYDISDAARPQLKSSVVCPGGQGDVSMVGDLLIMSVEQTRGRLDCGLQGVADPVSAARFRGIRIFDVSNPSLPTQVGAVQTCRGSHTHTIIEDPDDPANLYVYISGTSSVRSEEEMPGCVDESPFKNPESARFRIDVIQIPIADPQAAKIVSRPTIFSDPTTGAIAGLWEGGDHGDDTQTTSETNHCHDITAFPALGLAAGACSGNGILLDISDPLNPVRIDEVVDPFFAYWHSATFNNDGTKVIFTDEWGGGSRARCRAFDPKNWGADAIYDLVDGELQFRSYYKLPAPQSEEENCVAHNGSLVPVPGRDIYVQSWYQGGISVMDFTDSSNPVEIAYFDRGPVDSEELVMGGYWSSYFYQGKVYGTEIARGLDVFELAPSDYLSENEIAAAALATSDSAFNPQLQQRNHWPAEPVVALAYLDQLHRASQIDAALDAQLRDVLERASAALDDAGGDRSLSSEINALAGSLPDSSDSSESAQERYASLTDMLRGIADRLR